MVRRVLFCIGLFGTIFGGLGLAGNIETDGNLVIPSIIFFISVVLALTNLKGCEEIVNEEENHKRVDNRKHRNRNARPRFLPR